jgi:hypothetical protein
MVHNKRYRKHSSRRHRKYGHRGGLSSALSPATWVGNAPTSHNNTGVTQGTAMEHTASSNLNPNQFFTSGHADHLNQSVMNDAYKNQSLPQQAGGGGGQTIIDALAYRNQGGGGNCAVVQKGGVWNNMITDAIAPLVLLGLQQYYGPRNKSRMNKRMHKGKMTKRYRK